MSEPNGTYGAGRGGSGRGKKLPEEAVRRFRRLFEATANLTKSCREAGISRPTGRKYKPTERLPDLDI